MKRSIDRPARRAWSSPRRARCRSAGCSTGNESHARRLVRLGGGDDARSASIGMTQINQTAVFFTQMNEGAPRRPKAGRVRADHRERQQRLREAEQRHRELHLPGCHRSDRGGHRRQRGAAGGEGSPRARASRSSPSTPSSRTGSVETFVGVDNEKAGAETGAVDGRPGARSTASPTASSTPRTRSSRTSARTASASCRRHRCDVHPERQRRQRAGEGRDRRAEPGHRAARPGLRLHHGRAGDRGRRGGTAGATSGPRSSGWDLTKEVIAGIDSGLVRGRRAAGPEAGGRWRRSASSRHPRRCGPEGLHRRPDHDRDQGQRRRLPVDLPVSARDEATGGAVVPPDRT